MTTRRRGLCGKRKAAKDREEEFYDLSRADNIRERNKTRQDAWEEHLKDPMKALEKAMQCLEYPQGLRLEW